MTKNIVASVNARLRNLARNGKVDYNRIERLYAQERLLSRLAQSRYHAQFILKGGLLLYSHYETLSRPTRDIDFLGRSVTADVEALKEIFQEVCMITLDDAMTFDLDAISTSIIKEGADYEGVRLKIPAYLGKARQLLQLDIGFGDSVFPEPELVDYPLLLSEERVALLSYSLETVVAEKLQAMTMLYTINTRYKDFYDIYLIATTKQLNVQRLRRAVRTTFSRRNTPLQDTEHLFTEGFINDGKRNQQWNAFYHSLDKGEKLSFADIMDVIKKMVGDVLPSDGHHM